MGYFQESAGLGREDEGDVVDVNEPGGLDESDTNSADLAEIAAEEADIVRDEREAEDLNDRIELAEDVNENLEPIVAENVGLGTPGLLALRAAEKRIAGRRNHHVVEALYAPAKLESAAAGLSSRREKTAMHFENIQSSLKEAWSAIKAMFKKAWVKLKGWFVKFFDASKRLKSRAEKIRDRANKLSTTIDPSKKKIKFSGVKTLATNGKVQAGELVTGFNNLKEITSKMFAVTLSKDVDTKSEQVATAIGNFSGDETTIFNEAGELAKQVCTVFEKVPLGSKVVNSKIEEGFGDSSEVSINTSKVLPGDKAIVLVKGVYKNAKTATEVISALRKNRFVLSNITDKPREPNSEAEVLNASQIGNICDSVVDIADDIFDYKKCWNERDTKQEKVIKEIETKLNEVIKDIENDDNKTGAHARPVRALAGASVDLIRRDSSFRGGFISYAMNASGTALSFCERSIASHK